MLKKTKIVCTIGPASFDPSIIEQMAKSGMDVARLNFSHGTQEEKLDQIKKIRQLSREIKKPLAIMADLQGPKIRCGDFEDIRQIKKDEILQLSLYPVADELPLQFDLSPYVKKNQRIFLNDGLVELKVLEVKGKNIKTKALNSGVVSAHKGINIPDTNLKGASFTQKDFEDALFALEENVDYIALSFVQTPDDVKKLQELIKKHNSKAKVVVKIEKAEAVEHLEEIVRIADAVMVARGDLAIEIHAAEVPVVQQKIIKLCRQYAKPVIVATQMLESMIENPRPTRAEVSDVANAVLDQVDAVMLSAESASGKYPVEAVKTMSEIITSVEQHPEYKNYIKINWENIQKSQLAFSALASSAASIGYRIAAKVIAVGTSTGKTAKLISSFRPDSQIIAITHDETTKNQLSLVWGVEGIVREPAENIEAFWKNILEILKNNDFAKKDDQVVIVGGSKVGVSGFTDAIKVATL